MSQYKNQKAAALKYDADSDKAPVIVAAGSGYIASKIVEAAENNNVPIYQDNSLATLLSQMNCGSEIPEELYRAIVNIYIYFLNFTDKSQKEVK